MIEIAAIIFKKFLIEAFYPGAFQVKSKLRVGLSRSKIQTFSENFYDIFCFVTKMLMKTSSYKVYDLYSSFI